MTPATSADGVAGILGRVVAVVELSPRSVYDPASEKMRREAVQRWTGSRQRCSNRSSK